MQDETKIKTKFEKYKFRKYNKNYPKLYSKEKIKLKKILPKSNIEHIGSTSVKNLGGKGIIDIIISVPKKELTKSKNKIITAGYKFKASGGEKNRLFFEKDYKNNKRIRRVHLHLTSLNSKIWKNAIKIREILKYDKEKQQKYEQIKKDVVKKAKGNGKTYRRLKDKFLKEILK